MRGFLAVFRVPAGIIVATTVSFFITVSIMDPHTSFSLAYPNYLGLALYAVTLSVGFFLLWLVFTTIVELKTAVKLTTAVLIAAVLFAGYGAVLTLAVAAKGNAIVWKDFFATVAGGAAYGLIYWLVALLTKPRRLQT